MMVKSLLISMMNAGVNVVYEELDNGSHDIIAAGTKSEEAQDAWKRIADYLKTYHIQKVILHKTHVYQKKSDFPTN